MISLPKSEIKPISCKGICFSYFFLFRLPTSCPSPCCVSLMNNISLKKKFRILYSHTLFLLRYRFFTAWDKDIAGFSFIGTDTMFWYWFIMTPISLTAPPNCTPCLLSCFPMSKYGPWMSLRDEHCFVMVELESCDCVWHCLHKLISPETHLTK